MEEITFIIDSSILIDTLRGGGLWRQFINTVSPADPELVVPTIVIFELFSGKTSHDTEEYTRIMALLKGINRVQLTEDIAKKAGELYRLARQVIDTPDYIIAASALELNASVVTLNQKHFRQISGLKIHQW